MISHTLMLIFTFQLPLCILCAPLELHVGFKASASGLSSSFLPILEDPSQRFSLGFLRTGDDKITLAVTHLPSLQPLWQLSLSFSHRAALLFDGSIVVSDPGTVSFWSTRSTGDTVRILNNSNLVVERERTTLWQSFLFPFNTLVESQIFTSDMALVSSNKLYSLRLGDDFIAMYASFNPGKLQMYWKHRALEAKAAIVPGNGSIYATVRPEGFLGMYQNGTELPVDVLPFNSYNRPVDGFKMARLEPDGNFKSYIYNGSRWVSDYEAISSLCEMPNPCGLYGLCRPEFGSGSCSCLDNHTDFASGSCSKVDISGDFCQGEDFDTLRVKGVELPFKDLMGSKTAPSVDACEENCLRNCTCWGALYNNVTESCYFIDYPTRTMVRSSSDYKVGIFKVKKGGRKRGLKLGVGLGVLLVAVVALLGAIGFAVYRAWRGGRKRKVILGEDEVECKSPMPFEIGR